VCIGCQDTTHLADPGPLRELTRQHRRREGGIGEYPDNELGDLATAFDQVAEQVERRVSERTAALVDIHPRTDAPAAP
jgi:hypothetical protein